MQLHKAPSSSEPGMGMLIAAAIEEGEEELEETSQEEGDEPQQRVCF